MVSRSGIAQLHPGPKSRNANAQTRIIPRILEEAGGFILRFMNQFLNQGNYNAWVKKNCGGDFSPQFVPI
jgi:hypothetical protein